jgi:rod shape determining protein RodA
MKDFFKKTDMVLVIVVLAIIAISFLSLYSASHQPGKYAVRHYAFQQFIWFMLSVLVAVLFIKFGYQRWLDYSYIIFALNILMLLGVLFLGDSRYGAKRWFSLGLFSLQPSELCKISFLLVTARFVSDNRDTIKDIRTVVSAFILCVIPVLLIMKQPDLGTALVFLPIFFIIIFTAGAQIKHLLFMFLAGLATMPFLWNMLKAYQKKRLLVFLDPNIDPLGAGYTIIQSRIAVGSGGLFGKGWLSGTQNQLNFLPERHTDFIFSVIGEEWGFVGCFILLCLFLVLIKRLLGIADKTSDYAGKLLIAGIVTLIWVQVFVNIGMTIGIMPVVGLPLPLVSYGGSNLLTVMILLSLAISIKGERKIF